jgi:hypothetical protein
MIAAIALAHRLDLVTGNTSHYQRIEQLGYSLTLANWRISNGKWPPADLASGENWVGAGGL